MRITPQYSKVEIWIGSDPQVRALSFEAKGMFALLMTFPLMSKVPGLIVDVGPLGFCDKWNISQEKFETLFEELQSAGLVEADWTNRVVLVPWMLSRMASSRPRSISQAVCWGGIIFTTTPDCPLRRKADHHLRELMCDSPSLMESYLQVRSLTNKDVENIRAEGRPTPTPHQQLKFQIPDNDSRVGGSESTGLGAESHGESSIDQRQGDPDSAFDEGVQQLQSHAGITFDDLQTAKMRLQWRDAYAMGWKSEDLSDLGRAIARGEFSWVQSPLPAWLAKDVGRALQKMQDCAVKRGPIPPPRRPLSEGEKRVLRWNLDSRRRVVGVSDGPEKTDRLRADYDWEVEVLTNFHKRWLAGENPELSEIRAALANPPVKNADAVAVHDVTEFVKTYAAIGDSA